MATSTNKPTKLTIRSYQVGFGDCFLLTFHYPKVRGKSRDRHVLIDCGSTGKPSKAPSLDVVAEQIRQDSSGKLTAIVATHRHADHISGFATKANGKGSGDILRSLKPDLVMQPWTEDPDTPKDATGPKQALRAPHTPITQGLFIAGLNGMHQVAEAIQSELQAIGPHLSKSVANQLAFLGEENLKNLSAVKNLIDMGKQGKAEYLSYGNKTSLQKLLPGVKVHVLGPPTPKQYPEVAKQRARDASEFWQVMGVSSSRFSASALSPFPGNAPAGDDSIPPSSRWIVNRVRAIHGAQRLALVRVLDDAMNNTSLILLFEVGGKKFLFPGDAQIENWNYALKDSPEAKANRKLLSGTDFYKVGHHGSLNATPKTLWGLFAKRNPKAGSKRMKSAVSTMAGKHGSASSKTEVPRRTLVDALQDETDYVSTQTLKKSIVQCHTIEV